MGPKTLTVACCMTAVSLVATPLAAQPNAGDPWYGLYIGIGGNVGEAFGGNKFDFQDQSAGQTLSFQAANTDNSMLLGGIQIGQLWYVGGTALGIEDDVSFGKNINYLQSLRAVLGVPTGNFLIYGTGGVGFENANEEFAINSTSGEVDTFKGSFGRYGWVAGAGIEAMVAPHLSIGVEGLYYGLGHETNSLSTALGGEPFTVNVDRNFSVVRARINYRFTNLF